MRKSGGRVRITAQLIDATTGGHLWAERFDRDLTDIFALQDDVTGKIVVALALNLSAGDLQASPAHDWQSGSLRTALSKPASSLRGAQEPNARSARAGRARDRAGSEFRSNARIFSPSPTTLTT